MSAFHYLRVGDNPPKSINVMIEIPRGSSVKYELDAETGVIFVDRFLYTTTYYPFNYSSIPETKRTDGDSLDAIVLSQESVYPMIVIRSRPIGVLLAEDEKGPDSKIAAVPNFGVDPFYSKISSENEIPPVYKESD
ncbi:MAG: inorganic diphosphatase [archaeon]|nr:inorganic diphosphatase [archaeon]